jgi:hypothetical protein
MPWCRVSIIGDGTRANPYRPDIPSGDWSAHIPSNPDGSPRVADAVVFVVEQRDIPADVTALTERQARDEILSRDPAANPDVIRTQGGTSRG